MTGTASSTLMPAMAILILFCQDCRNRLVQRGAWPRPRISASRGRSFALVGAKGLNPPDDIVPGDDDAVGRHPLTQRAAQGLDFLHRLPNEGNGDIHVVRSRVLHGFSLHPFIVGGVALSGEGMRGRR